MRCFVIGPKSSGKTTLGRHLARKFGIFHISFRELLQEEILPKMKKPPLIDSDEWDDGESDLQEVPGMFLFGRLPPTECVLFCFSTLKVQIQKKNW